MGCSSSQPAVVHDHARTETKDVWDSDFRFPTSNAATSTGRQLPTAASNISKLNNNTSNLALVDRQHDVRLSATYRQEAAARSTGEIRIDAPSIPAPIIPIQKKLPTPSTMPTSFNPHHPPVATNQRQISQQASSAYPLPAGIAEGFEKSIPGDPMGHTTSPGMKKSYAPHGAMNNPGHRPQSIPIHHSTMPTIPSTGPLPTMSQAVGAAEVPGHGHRQSRLPDAYGGGGGSRPSHMPSRGPAPPASATKPPRAQSHDSYQLGGGNQNRRFEDCYIPGRDLGKGAFAKVFIGTEKSTGVEYAIKKIFDRSKMKWNGRDALMDEIGNLQKLRQAPNIVYLHEVFMEKQQCYLVMELLPGKELFERIIQKSTFTEAEARDSCRCVLNALHFMHERRMTHRDLKPENLLLVDELDIDKVKLSDFGFSKSLQTKNECRTLCGTPGYLAPEILERWPSYDVKCDIWSFGVILFLLLGGYLPFDSHGSNDTKQVFERTRNGQYYFYPQRWEGISQAAKDLIAKCLTVNPTKRISAQMALSHEWMGEGLALPKTIISAQSLASTYTHVRRQRDQKYGQRDVVNQVDRLRELNDDFTVFLEGRQADSIVSAMTGARTVGGMTMATNSPPFKEEGKSGKPFSYFYNKEAQLGKGGFATVYRCRNKRSGLTYAVKEVDTTNSSKAEAAVLQDEITALKYLRGAPSIIRLYDVFVEGKITYLIMEEMKGGDLLHRIIDKEVYTEREARDLCKVLFSAVKYCHNKQIAHRDIKLENLLLQEENNDSSIKLADFGFAKKVKKTNGLKTYLGTPTFMAPEIYDLRSPGYDERCDLWSVGVVVYCLLGGYLPFEGNPKEISVLVMRGEYHFHEEYWRNISPSAKKLISSFLQVDPSNRITAQQAMSSRWMTMDDAELSVVDLSLTKSRMQRMTTGKEKLKNAVRAIMGANKLQAAAGLKTSVLQGGNYSDYEMVGCGNGLAIDCAKDAILTFFSSEPQQNMESIAESESDADIEVCFEDVYELGNPIGVGSLAKIHAAKNLLSNKEYSVKKVIRRELHPGDFAALNDEIAVLKEVAEGGKTHVVCLYEYYEDPDATYLVMERIHGEILIDKLIQKKKYTEFDAKELVRNLLQGVRHCHSKRIAIRNLTLDNLLLPNESASDIIITDFEIAKKVLYRNALRTQCGTQEFVAPEVLENRPAYDVSCDMWTVGVIVFILLGGYYPFRGKTDAEILKNVRYGNFEFRERLWKGVSDDAKNLLRRMMTVNPDERVTVDEALNHPWIKADNSSLSNDLMDNVAEIRKEVTHKFKAAINTVVATQKLQAQL